VPTDIHHPISAEERKMRHRRSNNIPTTGKDQRQRLDMVDLHRALNAANRLSSRGLGNSKKGKFREEAIQ
jgi:hypothetical protein